MSRRTFLKAAAIVVALVASAAGAWAYVDHKRCALIFIAYAEQDELAPAWYDDAAQSCGIEPHVQGERGNGGVK